tara:strand:+ start:201 stop:4142 length:3942 start_codon:yes stop_codon:yes gene_type:complete
MNYKILSLIITLSAFLYGCGGSGGGGGSSNAVIAQVASCTGSSGQTITLSVSDTSITENSSDSVTLTATASATSCENITVTLSTSGTATNGTDYSSLNGQTITISSGSTTGTKTFTTTDDSTYEGDETVVVAISSVSGSSATESGTQSVTTTITENELTPRIQLSASALGILEGSGGSLTLTATATQAADEDITVAFSTSGTATEGTDYANVSDITIAAGSTTGTTTFTPTNDSTSESEAETAVITIESTSGSDSSTYSPVNTVTLRIYDSAPNFTAAVSDSNPSESGGAIRMDFSLNQVPFEDVSVKVAVSGTATYGSDYQSWSGGDDSDHTYTISAGSHTLRFGITPINDSLWDNGDETIIVTITDVSGSLATHSSQSLTATLTDNGESAPTVSLATSASSVYDNGSNLTLTATSTQASDEAITVVIGTSGTATEGADYANVSDITIAAGSTTGTTTFDPTSDTVNEGSETATIAISSTSGAGSSASGTTSVNITINEYALRTGTAFTEGTTSEQNTIKSRSTWTAIEAAGATHPYEQMGIHKVQSFSSGGTYLTGVGETIHIADFNCDVNHDIYDNKTITNLDDGGSGESTFDAATSSDNHCQGVAMFAAGDVGARSGVAPDADLVLSSIPNYEGSNEGDDYASDLDAARAAGAIVSNQSWGYNSGGTSYNISELESYISSNSLTNAQGLAVLMHGSSSGQALTDSNTYITALNNFESSGVIVWAAANDSGESDANAMAGLPELFPDLGEAWIVANVIEYTGDSDLSDATSSEFTLKGNKCGSTAEYCLSVDGWDVYAATYVDSGTSQYNSSRISYGSSWSAPMVSGGVALMAQAFPNHTPEQLVDRILASANNVWFTPEGNTTFTTHGNSVNHGYHSTWGHGVPDFYAALSPITSDGNPASMSLYTGNSIESSEAVSLGTSYITPSASFGNAISQGLIGEVGYAYDALNGGFKYDISKRINMTSKKAPAINLSSELSKLDTQLLSNEKPFWKKNFSNVVSTLSETDELEASITFGASSFPIQSFFESNSDSEANLSDFQAPYLEMDEGGVGLNANYEFGNKRLMLGATTPILINNLTGEKIGSRKSLVASLEYQIPSKTSLTLMTGFTQDKDNLLGVTGNDAYSMSGSKSNTTFAAFKVQNKLGNDLTLTGMAEVAKTNMSKPSNSFINSADNVKSSSLNVIATKKNITGEDSLSLSVNQPSRVDKGEMSIRLSNLAESDGRINYKNKNINLKPNGRQMVYGLSYRKDLDNDIGFSFKQLLTSNLNHINDSEIFRSSYLGLKYKDFKLGYNVNSQDLSKNTEFSFNRMF